MIFKRMHQEIYDLLEKIQNHNFNAELANGSLPKDKFIYYLLQDSLYLNEFSRALSLIAARIADNTHMHAFMQFALGAIQSEKDLHKNYITKFQQFLNQDLTTVKQSPACFMYSNFLLKTASLNAVEEAVASILPCFFVYHEVGKNMKKNLDINNPYSDWINLYSDKDFAEAVTRAINITNELGEKANVITQQNMINCFYKATELELMFWDSAYKKEEWSN